MTRRGPGAPDRSCRAVDRPPGPPPAEERQKPGRRTAGAFALTCQILVKNSSNPCRIPRAALAASSGWRVCASRAGLERKFTSTRTAGMPV